MSECGRCVWVEDGPLRVCTLPAGHEGKCSDGEAAWLHTWTHDGEGPPANFGPSCDACRWWDEDRRCRRHPPQVIAETIERGNGTRQSFSWPRVADSDWCGEFEAKR